MFALFPLRCADFLTLDVRYKSGAWLQHTSFELGSWLYLVTPFNHLCCLRKGWKIWSQERVRKNPKAKSPREMRRKQRVPVPVRMTPSLPKKIRRLTRSQRGKLPRPLKWLLGTTPMSLLKPSSAAARRSEQRHDDPWICVNKHWSILLKCGAYVFI